MQLVSGDTSKIKLFVALSDAYRGIDQQKSIENAALAFRVAEKSNNERLLAIAARQLGTSYRWKQDYENAIPYLRKAREVYHNLGDYLGAAGAEMDIGRCYSLLGKIDLALDTMTHSREMYSLLLSSTDSVLVSRAQSGILGTYHNSFAALYFENQFKQALGVLGEYEKAILRFGRRNDIPNLYSNIGLTYSTLGDYEKANEYYLKGLKIAEELGAWEGQRVLLVNLSDFYVSRGNYEAARAMLHKAHSVQTSHTNRKRGLGQISFGLGVIETKLGNYTAALEHYLRALRLFDQESDPRNMGNLKLDIAEFYYLQSEFSQAIDYLKQAREHFEQIHHKEGIANVFFQLGRIATEEGRFGDASTFHRQSLEYRVSKGATFDIALSKFELGRLYLKMADRETQVSPSYSANTANSKYLASLDSAASFFEAAVTLSRDVSDGNTTTKCLFGLGRVAALRANLPRAVAYYREACQLADSLHLKRELYELYASLAEVSSRMGNHQDAYHYHQLYSSLKDSVFNETSSKQLKETRAKYDSEKKDFEIRSLNQQNEIGALKAKQQESALKQAELQSARKETDIKLLNQTKELQQQQLLNANRALTERELEAKARSAELEAARKDQLLQEHNLQEQGLIMYGSIAFAVLTIALGVVLFNRFQLRKELDKRSAILEERRRISSDMHDDLGSSLSTIALLSQVMKQHSSGSNDRTEVEKISVAAQQSLEKMSEIVWSLNPRNDRLENLVAYIRKYAMEYFENSPIQCGVTMSGSIPDAEITGEQRRNVFLTVKESLHNIIKHSGAKSAELAFEFRDHTLQLSIHDNGKGIGPATENAFGNGIINMQRRMKEAGGEVAIENQNGTMVRLVLPLA